MKQVMMASLTLAILVGSVLRVAGQQAPAPAFTKVTLTELHCMGCAKNISRKVTAVAGVAEMRVDLNAKTIWAMHKPGMTPSPRGLWEAIERSAHVPTQMVTPSVTHTTKPAS